MTLAPHFTLGYTENIFEKSGLSKVDPAPVSDLVEGQDDPLVVPEEPLELPPQAARINTRPSTAAAPRRVNRGCRRRVWDAG